MIKSILVIGGTSQLGQSIKAVAASYPNYKFVFTNRQLLDLNNIQSIKHFFQDKSFDFIINCAAYTNVANAESEQKLANNINNLAVKKLAEIVLQLDTKLIHISTDYVFNGKQNIPYIETDTVEPQGVYGETKRQGEKAIQKILKYNGLIIRTSWMYSEYGNNFVKTMLRLGEARNDLNIIFDQVGTPTYSADLANIILNIIQSDKVNQPKFKTAIYHFSNEGVCSWYDFAKAIFDISATKCNVRPIETSNYPDVVNRPHYSVLNKAKIKRHYNLTIPYWKDSLQQCLKNLQENKL